MADPISETTRARVRSPEQSGHGDAIHVLLASDSNYAMPLTVAICSAAINCGRNRDLTFYVLQRDISPQIRCRVEHSLASTGVRGHLVWLDVPFDVIEKLTIAHEHLSAMIYARLLVQWVVPPDLDRIIYLDSDVVVLDDLGDLWDADIADATLLAAQDHIGLVSSPGGLENYRELGIPENNKYFNSGVLLINLKKWRVENRGEQLFRYLHDYRAIIRMEDQEALNAVLYDDWRELNPRWNWQILWKRFRHCEQAIPSGGRSLIHFTTNEKPWLPGCHYPEKSYFFDYLDRTDWAGWRVPAHREFWFALRQRLSSAKQRVLLWSRTAG